MLLLVLECGLDSDQFQPKKQLLPRNPCVLQRDLDPLHIHGEQANERIRKRGCKEGEILFKLLGFVDNLSLLDFADRQAFTAPPDRPVWGDPHQRSRLLPE